MFLLPPDLDILPMLIELKKVTKGFTVIGIKQIDPL